LFMSFVALTAPSFLQFRRTSHPGFHYASLIAHEVGYVRFSIASLSLLFLLCHL
jgi:hypothetical protein